jgi:hypothetical protein
MPLECTNKWHYLTHILVIYLSHILWRFDDEGKLHNTAFIHETNLIRVVLPNGVICLEGGGGRMGGAFAFSRKLEKIELPDTVAVIGEHSFRNCRNLISIESLPTSLSVIGERAFAGCRRLQEIALPSTLTTIGGGAFDGCSSLATLFIPCLEEPTNTVNPTRCVAVEPFSAYATAMHHQWWCSTCELQMQSLSAFSSHMLGKKHTKKASIAHPTTTAAATIAITRCSLWRTLISTHLPHVARVWAPDAIIAMLDGPFEAYSRYADLPPSLQAAPARIQSWAGVELWRWWTPPDMFSEVDGMSQFRSLSVRYRAMVWTVLLVCERHAVAMSPYGEVPVDLLMLIIGFCRRDVPVAAHGLL